MSPGVGTNETELKPPLAGADTGGRRHHQGKCSQWAPVPSGNPEGGLISPLLFACYINDLPDCVQTDCVLFADDVNPRPAGGGRFCPPPLSNIRDNLRTT